MHKEDIRAREEQVKHQLALLVWETIEIISSLGQYCTVEDCTRPHNSNCYKRAAIRRRLINQHQRTGMPMAATEPL